MRGGSKGSGCGRSVEGTTPRGITDPLTAVSGAILTIESSTAAESAVTKSTSRSSAPSRPAFSKPGGNTVWTASTDGALEAGFVFGWKNTLGWTVLRWTISGRKDFLTVLIRPLMAAISDRFFRDRAG